MKNEFKFPSLIVRSSAHSDSIFILLRIAPFSFGLLTLAAAGADVGIGIAIAALGAATGRPVGSGGAKNPGPVGRTGGRMRPIGGMRNGRGFKMI